MKKRPQALYWLILIVFVGAIFLIVQQYGKNNEDSNNSSQNTINSDTAKEDANANISDQAPSGTSNTNQTEDQKASQDVLQKFITALSSDNNTNIKNYSTSLFYASDFVKGIINDTTLGPDIADIVSPGEKINNYYVFQVKESYNIDKTNNAGVNGTYFYGLIKSNDKWLVNYRAEEKP